MKSWEAKMEKNVKEGRGKERGEERLKGRR